MKRTTFLTILVLIFTLPFFTGCSDNDDNPADNSASPHLEAVGTMLIHDSDTLVTVNGTSVEGELEIHEGDTLGVVNVLFLHPDGYWYDPTELHSELDEHDHYLTIEEFNANIVDVLIGSNLPDNTDDWAFGVAGLEEGETSARIKIYHIDHPDYVSPLIDFHVHHEHSHASAVGCKLVINEIDSVSVDGTIITGELNVVAGSTTEIISVWFLDPDGDWFQPHSDDGFSLSAVSDNTLLATVDLSAGNAWEFTVSGIEQGSADLTVSLMHEEHSDYASPSLPVTVVAPASSK